MKATFFAKITIFYELGTIFYESGNARRCERLNLSQFLQLDIHTHEKMGDTFILYR